MSAEEKGHGSMLAWYRTLIALKKTNAAFAQGDNVMLDETNTKVLSWMRKGPDGSQVVVACNFTAEPQTANLKSGGPGLKGSHARTLLKSPGGSDPSSLDAVAPQPFGASIGQTH